MTKSSMRSMPRWLMLKIIHWDLVHLLILVLKTKLAVVDLKETMDAAPTKMAFAALMENIAVLPIMNVIWTKCNVFIEM